MATHRIPIGTALIPDASGNGYWEGAALDDVNDRYPHELLTLEDSGTKVSAGVMFTVPKNYVGTPKVVVRWKTTATTGDVVFDVEYTAIAAGETLDPSADQEALSVTDSAPGTARLANDCEVSLTAGNLAPDDTVLMNVSRDGTDGADTLAADAQLVEAWFQYADA